MKINKISFALVGIMFAVAQSAQAQSLANASSRIASELGTQDAMNATTSCTLSRMTGSAGGNIGLPNQLMCMIKNQSLTATTGAAGVTKSIDIGGQTITAHIVLTSPGATVDGTTYDYEMKVWTCGSSCTSVSNFLPAVWATFSANSSKTVNKGVLVNNFSANSGQIKGSSFLRWDTGGNSTNKSVDLAMVDCSNSPTTAIYLSYTRTGANSKMNEIVSQSSGAVTRSALAWNTSNNTGNWQQDSTVSAGGDSPTWGGGFTRTATSTDYTYSAASTSSSFTIAAYPTGISGTSLSGANYQGITCSSIYTSGVSSITNGTGILTTPITASGGMTTNPPNI